MVEAHNDWYRKSHEYKQREKLQCTSLAISDVGDEESNCRHAIRLIYCWENNDHTHSVKFGIQVG